MLASNLGTTSIREAWSKTFDGKHPCKLCKVVHAGKSAEKKQDNQKPQTKLDLMLICGPRVVFGWLRDSMQPDGSTTRSQNAQHWRHSDDWMTSALWGTGKS